MQPAPPPTLVPRYLPFPVASKPLDVPPNDVDSVMAKGRHEIRRLRGQLEEQTKAAGKMEADRRERIKKLHEKVCQILIISDSFDVLFWCTVFMYVLAVLFTA